nr:hypothetical protein BaRGS_023294 [Batillaria attramentaria]
MADIIHKLFGPKHGKHSSTEGASSKSTDGEGYTKQQHEFYVGNLGELRKTPRSWSGVFVYFGGSAD